MVLIAQEWRHERRRRGGEERRSREERGRTDQQKIEMPCLNWKINGK